MTDLGMFSNPFDSDVVTDPERPSPADVAAIHKEAFECCCAAYQGVAENHRSWSVLMSGEAGCGKTHLLSRFRRWLDGTIEPRPSTSEALFVAVRMETGPGFVWRHLRRRLAEEATRRSPQGHTRLDEVLARFAAQANGKLDEALNQSPVADLGLDLARVLEHFAAGRHRRLCRSWLAGDSLTEADYQSLNVAPPAEEGTDDESAEFEARRIVLAVTRLSAPSPMVFCFDQIEALGLWQQNRDFGAFTRMGASLVDSTQNSLVLSTALESFVGELERGSMVSDFARISKERKGLQPLDWNQVNQLIQARLALIPELAGKDPVPAADLRAFYESQRGRCTPRRLIHEARRLFNLWQHRDAPPPALEEVLSAKFEYLWSDSSARQNAAESDGVLDHGLPLLLELLGHKTRHRPTRHVDLGVEAGSSEMRLAYGNHINMTSFAKWLRPLAEEESNEKLRLIRDARLPISATAKTAQERLKKISLGGGKLVRVEAEAIAALDAMRRLLTQATSGDLGSAGDTITAQTVREWLAANVPRGLAKFAEDLLGNQPPPPEPPDALLELLRLRKVVSLAEAVRLSRVPVEEIEHYARTHPDHIGLFRGSSPVVFQAVAQPVQGGTNGIS